MEQLIHKKIKIYSFIVMISLTVLSIATIILLATGNFNPGFVALEVVLVWLVFMFFPVVSIITSYVILHTEKSWIRKFARRALFISPVIYVGCIFTMNYDIMALRIASIIIMVALSYVVLLYLFVFSNPGSLTSTVIFISLILIGIIFKRFHLPLAGILLVVSLTFYSVGCYLFGIRCLYFVSTNKFLKLTVFFGGCIVAIFFLGMLFRFQHWPGHPLMIPAGQILLITGTIVVLLSLPSSGYFEWQEIHRRILKRMILPWSLMFLLFVLKHLLPEVDAVIWSREDNRVYPGFEMYDYEIPLRD